MVSAERLEQILRRMADARVAVIGDLCLDVYWLLDLSAGERSLETGKPTRPVREQRYEPGGAANVVANLAALGVGRIACFGVVGHDPFGERLLDLLRDLGADLSGMQVCHDAAAWQTLAYCKPCLGKVELPRFDCGNFNALPEALAAALVESLERRLEQVDLVLVNQQARAGIHTPHFRRHLAGLMRRRPESVFVYDGRAFAEDYGAAWLKLNASEALRLAGADPEPGSTVGDTAVAAAARRLARRRASPVFVTLDARGCLLCDAGDLQTVPGIALQCKTDPVGAGDAFLAGLGAALASGATPREAMVVGNLAAAVTVTKLQQTGTASPQEILALNSDTASATGRREAAAERNHTTPAGRCICRQNRCR